MFHEKFFVGGLLNGAGDALAVLRAEDEGAEDEQIESALQEVEAVFVFLGRHLTPKMRLFG
jgi:hypothetical protein